MPVRDRGTERLIQKVLGEPALYPDAFKAWVPQQVERSPLIKFTADQLPTVDKIHLVGDTGEPAFLNSWVNYGGGHRTTGFWIDPWRTVHICGLVATGTIGLTIFTLPGGYRPELIELFIVDSNSARGRVDVLPSGAVVASAGSNVYLQLNGISFRAFG